MKVGVPVSTADQINVYQENEELKEELQKLAEKVMSACNEISAY